jgi:SAM-dependent methyltransferase
VITAWAVFEHLHSPMHYFKEVARILKPGGKFVFLVTNSESLYGKAAHVEDIPRHTYHFSKTTLKRYADMVGLEMNRCIFDDAIFDGRGKGTFRYLALKLTGWTWENYLKKSGNYIQQRSAMVGAALDNLLFHYHWESKLCCSGIMIITMRKPK